jgi:hypothetical protein
MSTAADDYAADVAAQAAATASAATAAADATTAAGTAKQVGLDVATSGQFFVGDPSGNGSIDLVGPPAAGSSAAYSVVIVQPGSSIPSATASS